MRKLIIFLMVLAFAPMVGAASVDFKTGGVGGTVDVLPNTAYQIDVIADFSVVGFNVGAIAIDDGSVTATGTLHPSLTTQAPVQTGTVYDGTINGIVLFQISGAVGTGNPIPGSGSVLYSFDLTTPSGLGTLTIEEWTGSNPLG